jgi:hypothetical protein
MDNKDSIGQVSILVVRILICLGYFALANVTAASQSDVSETDEARMLFNYEAALASGDETAAVKHVLDVSEKTNGENDSGTVNLTHKYGFLLYLDGEYREATRVLKKALERSTIAHGASVGDGTATRNCPRLLISHIYGLEEAEGKKALPLELVESVTNVDPVSPSSALSQYYRRVAQAVSQGL